MSGTIYSSSRSAQRPARSARRPISGAPANQYQSLLAQLGTPVIGAAGSVRNVGLISANPHEGVTTVACNLAMQAAVANGLHVLLVDANTSKPRLHQIFDLPQSPGLCDMSGSLAEDTGCIHDMSELPLKSWPPVLRRSLKRRPRENRRAYEIDVPNISVVTSGSRTTATGLVQLAAEGSLGFSNRPFDLVIYDLPAVNSSNSFEFPLSYLDGVLFVVAAEETSDVAAKKSLRRIRDAKAYVLGVVFNKRRRYLPGWIDRKLGD